MKENNIIKMVILAVKKAWPYVKIRLRADAGVSFPEIMNICESSQVEHGFGYSNNNVLKRKINYLLDLARLEYFRRSEKARLFDDVYSAAQSWEASRRIVMKFSRIDEQ